MSRLRLSPKARTLMRRIRAELKSTGVRLRVYKAATIRADGDECSGYFDPSRMVMAIASGRLEEAEFVAILTHEYTHFQQWRDAMIGRNTRYARAWRNNAKTESLGAKGLSYTERYHSYRGLLELERQAEVGSMRWVERGGYGTPVERERLRKTAALYLYAHRLMFEKRRWFKDGKGNLSDWLADPRVWNATPSKLRGVNFNRIPRKLKRLLLKLF